MTYPGEFNIPASILSGIHDPEIRMAEHLKDIKTPFNAGGEMFASALIKYVRRLEDGLADDQKLVLENHQGATPMRVDEVAFPSGRTLVLIGIDPDGNQRHFFSHVTAVQLDIKIVSKEPKEERVKIGFHHLMEEDEAE